MIGYKAFNSDGTNRYGEKFEIDKKYHVDGDIVARFGLEGNGYYYCTTLADVFRFFPPDDVKVGLIEATGQIDRSHDEYNDYEIFACSDMKLLRYMSRQEVLNMILLEGRYSIEKAIKTYEFTPEEKDIVLDEVRGDFQLMGEVLWYCFDKTDLYSLDRNDYYNVLEEEYTKLDERLKERKNKKMR